MVVRYFNVIDIAVFPPKADSPPIIYPDAILSLAIAFHGLKPVARRNSEVLQIPGLMKKQELTSCHPFDRTKARHVLIIEQYLCFDIAE